MGVRRALARTQKGQCTHEKMTTLALAMRGADISFLVDCLCLLWCSCFGKKNIPKRRKETNSALKHQKKKNDSAQEDTKHFSLDRVIYGVDDESGA